MAKLNINGRIRDVQVEADTAAAVGPPRAGGADRHQVRLRRRAVRRVLRASQRRLVRSCSLPVGSVKPTDKIVTIEGLSATSSHPVQKAWAALDVPQCGYCQSGQIMAAAALLKRNPKPTDRDIDEAMSNICRCGTYQRIRAAVHMAASQKGA
jgi:isoquinoline 1-oxidoreductase alpha subunit